MTKRRRKNVAHAMRRSRTIRGGLMTLAGTLAAFFNDAVAVALDAAMQATALAPLVGLGAQLGIDTQKVGFSVAVAGIALSMFARFHDASTGSNAK
jgi:hypothetical protein